MSKTRRKNKSELEHFRGVIKEQAKLIRSLERKLRSLEKKEHIFDKDQDMELSGDSEDTYVELPKLRKCESESCGKGFYVEFAIKDLIFGTCNICGVRKRLK